MSAYDIERCIGWALLVGLVAWVCTVGALAWRDERRAQSLRDEADAAEFTRSLREHPAGQAIVIPTQLERRCAVLERRAAWLRRRIAERPDASSFDRRELDALQWVLTVARADSGSRS